MYIKDNSSGGQIPSANHQGQALLLGSPLALASHLCTSFVFFSVEEDDMLA